jgi:hypothetical protein
MVEPKAQLIVMSSPQVEILREEEYVYYVSEQAGVQCQSD